MTHWLSIVNSTTLDLYVSIYVKQKIRTLRVKHSNVSLIILFYNITTYVNNCINTFYGTYWVWSSI